MALAKFAHEGVSMTDVVRPVATWRKVLGAILDFLTVFFVGGYAIGYLTGNVTAEVATGTPATIHHDDEHAASRPPDYGSRLTQAHGSPRSRR